MVLPFIAATPIKFHNNKIMNKNTLQSLLVALLGMAVLPVQAQEIKGDGNAAQEQCTALVSPTSASDSQSSNAGTTTAPVCIERFEVKGNEVLAAVTVL